MRGGFAVRTALTVTLVLVGVELCSASATAAEIAPAVVSATDDDDGPAVAAVALSPGGQYASPESTNFYLLYFTVTMSRSQAKGLLAGSSVASAGIVGLINPVAGVVAAAIYAYLNSVGRDKLDRCPTWKFNFNYVGQLIGVTSTCRRGGGGSFVAPPS